MRNVFDLSTLDWRLAGWHPWCWRLNTSMESQAQLQPDISPLPASVCE